ncbi:unnamed protein product [Brassica rapa subsp. trilocularis]
MALRYLSQSSTAFSYLSKVCINIKLFCCCFLPV